MKKSNFANIKINILKMKKLNLIGFLILFLIISFDSSSQITSSQANKEIIKEDEFKLFLYNKIENISLLYEQEDIATFEWSKFDESTQSWDNIIQTQTGQATTFLINEPGGYALKITDGISPSKTFKCWAFEPKIIDLSIEVDYEDCFQLLLMAQYETIPLIYYDNSGQQTELEYDLKYEWSSEPNETSFENSIKAELEAPYENTEYTLEIIPFSIMESSASSQLKYEAIAVKAAYKSEELKADVPHELHTSLVEGSAPIEIQFTDESKGNITAREWKFTGSKVTKGGTQPFHVFTAIGEEDEVILTVRNEMSGCEDTVEDPVIVKAFELLVEAPNTFTPNAGGPYDEFRVVYRSVKKYKIVIFNRWGRKVYESTDPAHGWDGRIGKTLAAPGVYFYLIEAEGFNKDEKIKRKGNIHLIRGR